MAYTGQQIADLIRPQINDDFKRKVTDAELLAYINQCAKQLYMKRPDLFIGALATAPADIALGGTFPGPDLYVASVVDYCVSMTQRPDDEDATARVSDGAMKKFLRDIHGD